MCWWSRRDEAAGCKILHPFPDWVFLLPSGRFALVGLNGAGVVRADGPELGGLLPGDDLAVVLEEHGGGGVPHLQGGGGGVLEVGEVVAGKGVAQGVLRPGAADGLRGHVIAPHEVVGAANHFALVTGEALQEGPEGGLDGDEAARGGAATGALASDLDEAAIEVDAAPVDAVHFGTAEACEKAEGEGGQETAGGVVEQALCLCSGEDAGRGFVHGEDGHAFGGVVGGHAALDGPGEQGDDALAVDDFGCVGDGQEVHPFLNLLAVELADEAAAEVFAEGTEAGVEVADVAGAALAEFGGLDAFGDEGFHGEAGAALQVLALQELDGLEEPVAADGAAGGVDGGELLSGGGCFVAVVALQFDFFLALEGAGLGLALEVLPVALEAFRAGLASLVPRGHVGDARMLDGADADKAGGHAHRSAGARLVVKNF
jgi:hypothetical protein